MSEDVRHVIEQWGKIVSDLSLSMAAMLKNAKVSQGEGSSLVLAFDTEMQKGYFDQEDHRTELENVISDKIQKNVEVKTVFVSHEEPVRRDFFDPRKMNLEGVEFEYED